MTAVGVTDETSSGRPSSLPLRSRWRTTSGAPVSITRVPGAGDWETTVFDGKPLTAPAIRNEKPASLSVPFEKTNAWRRRSGTTSTRGATGATLGAGVATGFAPSRCAAAYVSAAVARSHTTVRASKRGTNVPISIPPSAGNRWDSSPRCGEVDDLAGLGGAFQAARAARGVADDGENGARCGVSLDGVEPAEGGSGE